jgi:hypothetical protein
VGGSDGNGNVETREVLEPLADIANRLWIAVVGVKPGPRLCWSTTSA